MHDGHDSGGSTLGSGDYIPAIADHPTHTAVQPVPPPPTIDWATVDATSRVLIPVGVSVTLPANVEADEIKVEGALTLDPAVNTTLKVTTLLVAAGGRLVAKPNPGVKHTVTFTDKPLAENDSEQITHGLIVLGEIDVQGEEKLPYAKLAKSVAAGSSTVELTEEPMGWEVGDTILLPDSASWASQNKWSQRERRTIAAIDGNTITVASPFKFAHEGVKDYLGNVVAYAPVANLTRSVTFKSENQAGVRAHSLFGENAKVSLRYATFKDMGRTRAADWLNSSVYRDGKLLHYGTNQIGRYSLHLHHSHTPALIEGCVVDSSPKWGLAVHNSDGNQIAQNVFVDCVGAGIATEQGTEKDNLFEGNYVIGCNGSGLLLMGRGEGRMPKMVENADHTWRPGGSIPGDKSGGDIGHEGAGLWLHGTQNSVVGNIVANAQTVVTVWVRNNGDADNYGFRLFLDNTGIYCNSGGIFDGTQPPESVEIKNLRLFGVDGNGMTISYSSDYDIDGLTVIGRGHNSVAGFAHNFLTSCKIRNANIQLMDYGAIVRTNYDIADSFFAANRSFNIRADNSNWAGDMGAMRGAIRNVRHEKSATHISSFWYPDVAFVPHVGAPRYLNVYDYQGKVGDDFELLMREQAADCVVKAAGAAGRKTPAEITNGELWSKYGVALGGKVAPATATTRPNIIGLMTPIPSDQQGPAISDIQAIEITATSATIRWTTDEPATSALEYDLLLDDNHYGKFATPDNTLKKEHAIMLTGLTPKTTYSVRPYSTDESGNTTFLLGEPGKLMERIVFKFKTL